MPRYAVMTFMFKHWFDQGKLTLPAMFKGFAEAGAQGVEPFHLDFVEDPALAGNYRRMAEDAGLSIPAVDVMCNLAWFDDAQKQKGREDLHRGLEICSRLGATIAHVAGHKVTADQDPAIGRQRIAEQLIAAADLAKSYNVVLAIEDFPSPTLISSAAHCKEVLDLCHGHVKFLFDTGNFLASGGNPIDAYPMLADQTVHIHVKDNCMNPEAKLGYTHCRLCEGVIPNEQVLQQFASDGYDQWIALEAAGSGEIDPVTIVKRELPMVKQWFEGK